MPIEIIKVKKSPYYYLRGTYRGVYVYKTTKTNSRKIADELRKEAEDEIDANGRVRTRYTLADAVEKFLETGASNKYLTADVMFNKATNAWKPGIMSEFADMPLDRIDQISVDIAARKVFPWQKPQTLNRQFYAPLITVLNYASRLGMCEKREWMRPRVKRSDIERKKWFPYDDAAKFYAHAPDHLKAIFVFCIYTGARITEAIELEIKDINLESKWAVLNATKTDGFRGVPLHPAIIARILTSCYWEANKVFPQQGKNLFLTQKGKPYASKRKQGLVEGGGYFKTAWNATLKRSGLKGYTPYSMRHTFNNWLIMAGVNQATREALMGHDNGSTNAIYSDVPQAELILEVSKLPDITVHGFSTPVSDNS